MKDTRWQDTHFFSSIHHWPFSTMKGKLFAIVSRISACVGFAAPSVAETGMPHPNNKDSEQTIWNLIPQLPIANLCAFPSIITRKRYRETIQREFKNQ
jgi:hypothetical protein